MDLTEIFRIKAVLPFVRGRLLDIGCGYNNLVKRYKGEGVGVDIFDWGERPNYVVERTDCLPFEDETFDTITFLACLNHIPYRVSVLKEARRILKKDGRIIITMIAPLIGKIAHLIEIKDELMRGEIHQNEKHGLSLQDIKAIFKEANLIIEKTKSFEFGLNKIYLLKKQ
ncbi:MAG: methyltransferase domain-containing protein [bacterium]